MVSLEDRNVYFSQLMSQPETQSFAKWLSGIPLEEPSSTKLTDALEISLVAMYSIQNNRQDLFCNVYSSLCLREPKKDSPYIFNDILIFSNICGVVKFNLDVTWLKEACKLRLGSIDTEVQEITQSFCEILEGNLLGTTHCPEIAVVCSSLLDGNIKENALLNKAYGRITKKSFPPYNSLFLNAIAIRAFDVIVESKTISSKAEYELLLRFKKSFEFKSKLVANIIWCVTSLLVGLFSFLYVFGGFNDYFKEKLVTLINLKSVFGIGSGITLIPLLAKRKSIVKILSVLMQRFWGEILMAIIFALTILILFIVLW